MIDVHNGYGTAPAIRAAKYPVVKRHLDLHYEKLSNRQDQGATPYNLRNCAYHEDFRKEKLFWMDLTPKGRFSYVPSGTELFCANTVYFMHGPMMKCLAAYLNSSLITWYVNRTSVTSGMGTARWFSVTVETIPIPLVIEGGCKLELLVDNLLRAKNECAMNLVEESDSAIDSLIYEAYGISRTQKGIIRRANIV